MVMEYAQTVFDGRRHEGICRKVLFGEHAAVCSCRSPFPIPAPATICDTCGESVDSVCYRPHGLDECLPCYRATLAHGHLHVDHNAAVNDCPLCQQERHEDKLIGSREGR